MRGVQNPKPAGKGVRQLGVPTVVDRLAVSGKGWWRLADTPQAHRAMSLSWFKQIGLIVPDEFSLTLQRAC